MKKISYIDEKSQFKEIFYKKYKKAPTQILWYCTKTSFLTFSKVEKIFCKMDILFEFPLL